MDMAKLFTVISAFLLIVCLVFSITSLASLRNALEENDALQAQTEALNARLDDCVEELNRQLEEHFLPTAAFPTENEPTFYVREVNGRVGVYTADGSLLYSVELSSLTLPPAEREALANGIEVHGWKALLALIRDHTS